MGLNDIGTINNDWSWSDGGFIDYFNWTRGQPDNSYDNPLGEENCVAIYSNDGLWSDEYCLSNQCFLCNSQNPTSAPTNAPTDAPTFTPTTTPTDIPSPSPIGIGHPTFPTLPPSESNY